MALPKVSLYELISFEGFSFGRVTYHMEELEILNPRLEAMGYTDIKWFMGEADSFGPLSRYCTMTAPDGVRVEGWYA